MTNWNPEKSIYLFRPDNMEEYDTEYFSSAQNAIHLLEKYEKKIADLEKRTATLTGQAEKLKRFVASRGLGEAFAEFVKSLAPKTMKKKLEEAKADAAEHSRQKRNQQVLPEKRYWQQEM